MGDVHHCEGKRDEQIAHPATPTHASVSHAIHCTPPRKALHPLRHSHIPCHSCHPSIPCHPSTPPNPLTALHPFSHPHIPCHPSLSIYYNHPPQLTALHPLRPPHIPCIHPSTPSHPLPSHHPLTALHPLRHPVKRVQQPPVVAPRLDRTVQAARDDGGGVLVHIHGDDRSLVIGGEGN